MKKYRIPNDMTPSFIFEDVHESNPDTYKMLIMS